MRPAARPTWEELQAALISTTPDCEGDPRYTADELSREDRAELAEVCTACPLFDTCTDYALADKPAGGWWPGHNL